MITLSKPELKRITGGRTRAEQIEWLRAEGIPFKVDHTGVIQVLSAHVAQWVQGVPVRAPQAPRMDLIR